MRYVIAALIFITGLAGCANPSIERVNKPEIQRLSIDKIFVPRFEGNPAFVEESTDIFIAKLEPLVTAKVVQGSVIRTESSDVVAGGNLAPTEFAIAKAKEAGAQVLVMGKVTSHNSGVTMNGFSTVRVINVVNGQVIASFHRPSGLLFAYSEHQCVLEAVSITAEDVAAALRR